MLDGVVHELSRNDGDNCLHGGARGFDTRVWGVVEASDGLLALACTSPDGEMGFPGDLETRVEYRLDGQELRIAYHATTSAPTIVNLTNHTCWNLAGEGSGSVDDHVLELRAGSFTPSDPQLIPTGEIAAVEGTPLDFRTPTPIGAGGRGFDHNFVLEREDDSLVLAARVTGPEQRSNPGRPDDGAWDPALHGHVARRHACRYERPLLPEGRLHRARNAALPRFPEPPRFPTDHAAAARDLRIDDRLPARRDRPPGSSSEVAFPGSAELRAAERHCHPDELKAFVRERVAGYKYPRVIEFVDQLPYGPTGKVERKAALELLGSLGRSTPERAGHFSCSGSSAAQHVRAPSSRARSRVITGHCAKATSRGASPLC